MNDRAWIATRKGLFELRSRGGAWQIERVSFLGEPVTMVLPPQRRRLHARGAEPRALRRQGACLATTPALTWTEVATPTYPAQPEGAEGVPWKLVQIWSLAARGDTIWAGTLAGRAVPLAGSRPVVAARRSAVGTARARRVVRRRLRRAGHPLDLPASAA